MSLATLFNPTELAAFQDDEAPFKARSTELLRSHILSGRIPPGTKLVEREVATLLGVSRMPVRDALMELEREGLVVSRPYGRYVIEPDETSIRQLFEVRVELESLAVARAVAHRSPQNCAALRASLERMRAAIRRNDRDGYVQSDLAAHQLVWEQARNPYLIKMLNSLLGPIFMFVASHTDYQLDWNETLQMHEELTEHICAGRTEEAVESICVQLADSLRLSLAVFERKHAAADHRT